MLKLRLLTGPRAGRQLRVSDTKPVSIGRRKGRLRLHDSRVSKNHAEIYYDNGLWLLRDLGSANGTYVNRKRIKGMIELEPGDQVQMGRVLLKIVRCDMIGMDTKAFTPDTTREDTTREVNTGGLTAPVTETGPIDDDFDLEDLFDDSEDSEDDLNEASAAFDAIARVDAVAKVDTPADAIDEQAEVEENVEDAEQAGDAVPEPVSFAIDEPVDDDDSFFADLSESTDASNGAAVSLEDQDEDDDVIASTQDAADQAEDDDAPIELAGGGTAQAVADREPADHDEEPDPFLSGASEPEEEPTGDDLISLDDESSSGPSSAGTTLLTAAHNDGTPIDAPEHSDAINLDETNHSEHREDGEEHSDDDDDDEPPVIVGLALEHAPPQQPVVTDQALPAQEPAADDAIAKATANAFDEVDELNQRDEPDETDPLAEHEESTAPAVDSGAIAEDLELEPQAVADVELDKPAFEIDEIEIDESAFEISDADQLSDSALFDALDLEDDPEPTQTTTPPQANVADAVNAIDEPFSEIDLPPGIASLPLDELEDLREDEPGAVSNEDEDDDELVAERDAELDQAHDKTPKDEPALASAVIEDEAVLDKPDLDAPDLSQADLDGPEVDPEFDIDAAFEALSAGLDDTVAGLPAIDESSANEAVDAYELDAHDVDVHDVAPTEADAPDLAEQSVTSDQPAESDADALIGSQLDVSFIQDALSKLENDQPIESPPQEDDELPKASLSPAASQTVETPAPAQTPPDPPKHSYLHSAPPGLNTSGMNPTTTLPPSESTRHITPHQSGNGVGRWLIILLLFLGIGGVGGYLISQNYDRLIGNRTNPASSNTTQNSGPIVSDNTPDGPTNPASQPDNTDTTESSEPVEREGPNPFSSGPPVIGGDALQGLFRDSSDSRPLDLPKQPTINTDTHPDPIINPNLPKVGNTDPDSQNPDPNPDLANNPTQPTPTVTPAVDQKPARIVFLVDASGSLVDSLPQMLVWLNEALRTIEEDEQFALYFFQSGKPIPIKPEGMIKPTRTVLAKVSEDWLSSDKMPVFPSGRSDPSKAIAQALSLEPTDIYLLSDDAFAFSQGDTTPGQALTLVKEAIGDKKVRVHGVQFFYRSEQNILETLANQYDGTYEFVRERVVPNADPIDLLEELGNE